MAFLNDSLSDLPLQYLEDNGSRLDICSAEPATFTAATVTLTLGNYLSTSYTGPADRAVSGRKTTVDAITGASVTGSGTATHWAYSYSISVGYYRSDIAASGTRSRGDGMPKSVQRSKAFSERFSNGYRSFAFTHLIGVNARTFERSLEVTATERLPSLMIQSAIFRSAIPYRRRMFYPTLMA